MGSKPTPGLPSLFQSSKDSADLPSAATKIVTNTLALQECRGTVMTPERAIFLCERCGYALEPQGKAPLCPECGLPVEQSRPEFRIGTPWQRRPGLASWVRTIAQIFIAPGPFWQRVRMHPDHAFSLLLLNLSVASALMTCVLAPTRLWNPHLGYVFSFFTVGLILLMALTTIEFAGIRFFGRQHGFHITPRKTLIVIAHASAGWLVSGVGVPLTIQVAVRLNLNVNGHPPATWPVELRIISIFLPFAVGMATFSIFAGIGYRALRYANELVREHRA